MKKLNITVVDKIVLSDMCCGCGTCAGVCPSNCLVMAFDRYGEYKPYMSGDCSGCQLCLRVCPFNENNENEIADVLFPKVKDIKKNDTLGYYQSCHMGFANKDSLREKGTSGGMVTFLLSSLFNSGEIDAAIVVTKSVRKNVLFESHLANSVDEIHKSAKSKYYPIEHSQVLKHIIKNDGKYAFVGLPCHIYGIRKAQKYVKKIDERIIYFIGLICGHGMSANLTEFLIQCAGIPKEQISKIEYRDKKYARRAWNFDFMVTPINDASKSVRIKMAPGSPFFEAWSKRLFVPNACDYCDDIFSELADASFMDAWLPEKLEDILGNSIVISRSDHVTSILRHAALIKSCDLEEIDVSVAVRSQKEVGVVTFKHDKLPARLWMAKKIGNWVPERRVEARPPWNVIIFLELLIIRWNRWFSRKAYCNSLIREMMGPHLTRLGGTVDVKSLLNRVYIVIFRPVSLLKRTIKRLLGANIK